jgi:hypothetical protein
MVQPVVLALDAPEAVLGAMTDLMTQPMTEVLETQVDLVAGQVAERLEVALTVLAVRERRSRTSTGVWSSHHAILDPVQDGAQHEASAELSAGWADVS